MRAAVVEQYGKPLSIRDIPTPDIGDDDIGDMIGDTQWAVCTQRSTGREYYYNFETEERSWSVPDLENEGDGDLESSEPEMEYSSMAWAMPSEAANAAAVRTEVRIKVIIRLLCVLITWRKTRGVAGKFHRLPKKMKGPGQAGCPGLFALV